MGEAYKSLPSRRTVPDVPPQFRAYIDSIAQRSKGWKSQPYYIRDNFKGGTIAGGLNPIIPQRAGQISGTTKAPAPQPCTKYDAQISELKQSDYTFGLDCSRLDALRTAGNESQLYQEIERLTALKAERYGQWQEAATQLDNALKLIDQNEDKTAYDTGIRTYYEKRFATKRYYADCIQALKDALAKVQTAIQDAKERKRITDTINAADKQAKWFKRGKCKILVEKDPTNNGSTTMDGKINLTKERIQGVKSALDKIKDGKKSEITWDEADAMATLWHETTHNRNIQGGFVRIPSEDEICYMELANEFVARKTLPEFYKALGCEATPHAEFMTSRTSTGYDPMVVGYDHIIKSLKLPSTKVVSAVKEHLFNEKYNSQLEGLKKGLKAGGFYDLKKADGFAFTKDELDMAARDLLEICRRGFQGDPNAVKKEIDDYLSSLL